jgi:hypothetical protein
MVWRHCRLAGLCVLLAALGLGCNSPLQVITYFFGPEPSFPPGLKEIADPNNKEVKVAVLAYAPGLDCQPDLLKADRDIVARFVKRLRAGSEHYKEKVTVLNPVKVEDFKNNNPGWHSMDLDEIGDKLGVDYLIYLEFNKLELYEPNSNHQMYRGHADIDVTLQDVKNPDNPQEHEPFTCTYPRDITGAVPCDSSTLSGFATDFYEDLTVRLSWLFVKHPTQDDYQYGSDPKLR